MASRRARHPAFAAAAERAAARRGCTSNRPTACMKGRAALTWRCTLVTLSTLLAPRSTIVPTIQLHCLLPSSLVLAAPWRTSRKVARPSRRLARWRPPRRRWQRGARLPGGAPRARCPSRWLASCPAAAAAAAASWCVPLLLRRARPGVRARARWRARGHGATLAALRAAALRLPAALPCAARVRYTCAAEPPRARRARPARRTCRPRPAQARAQSRARARCSRRKRRRLPLPFLKGHDTKFGAKRGGAAARVAPTARTATGLDGSRVRNALAREAASGEASLRARAPACLTTATVPLLAATPILCAARPHAPRRPRRRPSVRARFRARRRARSAAAWRAHHLYAPASLHAAMR
jgi:hypothetical protein